MELEGSETVLDAGCGSGRVTRFLLERLPEGRVIGVDASPAMVEEAKGNLAEFGDRVAFQVGDLVEAQCGGEGNVAEWERAVESVAGDERFASYFRDLGRPWNFASVGDTEVRLARAGFDVDRVWLERRTYDPPEPREYVRTVGLSRHLARLPDDLQDEFIDAVLGSMLRPLRLEYVRLNISATKGRLSN